MHSSTMSYSIDGVNLVRLPENTHRCSYGNCNETNNLVSVPIARRFEILRDETIFIPNYARVCAIHLENNNWNECRGRARSDFTERQLATVTDLMNMRQIEAPEFLPVFPNLIFGKSDLFIDWII